MSAIAFRIILNLAFLLIGFCLGVKYADKD